MEWTYVLGGRAQGIEAADDFRVSLTITYGEGQRAFSRLTEAISAKTLVGKGFTWFGKLSVDHFSLRPSPTSYSRFEADTGEDRVGVQGSSCVLCSVVDPEIRSLSTET